MGAFRFCLLAALVFASMPVAAALAAPDTSPAAESMLSIPPGQIDRAAQSLDGVAQALLRRTGVPGMAIAVVHNDKVIFIKSYGVRRAGTNQRVDANTVFELASVSKPIGASVVAGAVGRAIVRWDDPISKYIPDFTLADPYVGKTVTIADLYAHRSGLPAHAGDLLEDLGYDRTYVLAHLQLEALDPFRVTYHYTNFGMTAGAQAVANAAHTTWEDLSSDIIYRPLGMTSTSSRFADYARSRNKADLHVRIGTRWVAKYTRNADAQAPAGGVSSSVRDMARWLRFELANGKFNGQQIVDAKALLATRNPNLMSSPLDTPISRASFYGYGIGVGYDSAGRLRLSHSGAFANGGATTIVMLPSEHLGIVVLTNGIPIGLPESVAADFMDRVEFGKSQRDWFAAYSTLMAPLLANTSVLEGKKPPAHPAPALANSAYVGTYDNDYFGPAAIEERSGHLVVVLGPKRMAYPLSHWNGNEFSFEPSGENANGVTAMTFTTDAAGTHATKFVIEYLNEGKHGTFTRHEP